MANKSAVVKRIVVDDFMAVLHSLREWALLVRRGPVTVNRRVKVRSLTNKIGVVRRRVKQFAFVGQVRSMSIDSRAPPNLFFSV